MQTVKTTRARLHGIIKATIAAASTDLTRAQLTGVHLEAAGDRLTAVATNGHFLIAASVGKAVSKPESVAWLSLVEAKELAKILKPTKKTRDEVVTVEIADEQITVIGNTPWASASHRAGPFPPWREVVPARRSRVIGDRFIVGVNPAYLATIGKAIAGFLGNGVAVRWSVGESELDPIRIDADDPGAGEIVAVLMPVRIA